jgi:hypothetical protein
VNRFQYLADLLHSFSPEEFVPVGLVSVHLADGPYVVLAAIENPGASECALSGLSVEVTSEPSSTVVAAGRFFDEADELIVQAETIYMAELQLGAARTPPISDTTTGYSFHWESLTENADTSRPCPGVT